MKSLRTSLVLLAAIGVICVAGSAARATVFTSLQNGNDTAPATWDVGVGYPNSSADTAVISAGTTVTLVNGSSTNPPTTGLPSATIQGTGILKFTGGRNDWANVANFQGTFQYHTTVQKIHDAGQGIQYAAAAGNDFTMATLYCDNAFALGNYSNSGFKWAGWVGNGAIATHDTTIHMVISSSIAPGYGAATGTLTFSDWYGNQGYDGIIDLGQGGSMSFKVLGDGTVVTGSDLVQAGKMNFLGGNTINVALPATATAITNLPLVAAALQNYDANTNAPLAAVGTNKITNWANVTGINFTNTAGYSSYSLTLSADGNQLLLNATPAPEPATLGLLILGGLGVLARRRRA